MINPSIYSYITEQISEFESEKMRIGDNWEWNFRDHVQLIFHLKNGVFFTGNNDYLRAFKNIIEPMLQLAYWTEDIDVKDVLFYTEGANSRVLSFLLKKYHDEVYVREHDLDELFDEITESDIDYGGVLVQKTNEPKPEVKSLIDVAFCDQTDIKGGAIGFRYNYSPDGLRKMAKNGWGQESNGATISIEELIVLAEASKQASGTNIDRKNETPSKNIEVVLVRGALPEHYLKDNDEMDDWYDQLHVVAFYTDEKGNKNGVTLYRKSASNDDLMFHTSQKVANRALGRGAGEVLIHPQIWTNFMTIHKMNMLEAGSKVPLQTDDEGFANRNKIRDMENLEVAVVGEGKSIRRIDTLGAPNIQVFSNAINEWFEHTQLSVSAFDPVLGKEAVSGTTFRGQERTVAQGRGAHDRRRGKRAKFIEAIYRKLIIPQMIREITKGKKFMATLTSDEMKWVREQLATNYANKKIKERILDFSKPMPTKEEQEMIKQTFKNDFGKKGNRVHLEILKDEFKGAEIRMGINVANKQKDIAALSDKLLSVFQFIFANPQAFQQAMQSPALAKSFNDILEYSGLNQSDFMTLMEAPEPVEQPAPQGQQPQMALSAPQE